MSKTTNQSEYFIDSNTDAVLHALWECGGLVGLLSKLKVRHDGQDCLPRDTKAIALTGEDRKYI